MAAGIFMFPLTQAGLRLMGRPGRVSPGNGLFSLGSQVAVVVRRGENRWTTGG